MSLAAHVYASQLHQFKYGFPLWYPEPHEKKGPVEIGDVGYIFDGSFRKLFNVTKLVDDFGNRLPDGAQALEFDREELVSSHHGTLPPKAEVSTRNVKKFAMDSKGCVDATAAGATAGVSYQCMRDQGALLAVDANGADSEKLVSNKVFGDYMLQHHDSWLEHMKKKGITEELIMVRGTVKASRWLVVAFTGESSDQSLDFAVSGGPFGGVDTSLAVSNTHSTSIMHRISPALDATNSGATPRSPSRRYGDKNHCVFVSRYKVARKFFRVGPRTIRAEGEHRDWDRNAFEDHQTEIIAQCLGESESSGPVAVIEDDVDCMKTTDPLDILLKYIQRSSGCETAIASDDDIYALQELGFDITPDYFEEHLRSRQPLVHATTELVGCLALSDYLEHDVDKPYSHQDRKINQPIESYRPCENSSKSSLSPAQDTHLRIPRRIHSRSPHLENDPSTNKAFDRAVSQAQQFAVKIPFAFHHSGHLPAESSTSAGRRHSSVTSEADVQPLNQLNAQLFEDNLSKSPGLFGTGNAYILADEQEHRAVAALTPSRKRTPNGDDAEPDRLAGLRAAWIPQSEHEPRLTSFTSALIARTRGRALSADDHPLRFQGSLQLRLASLDSFQRQIMLDNLAKAIETLSLLDRNTQQSFCIDNPLKISRLADLSSALLLKRESFSAQEAAVYVVTAFICLIVFFRNNTSNVLDRLPVDLTRGRLFRLKAENNLSEEAIGISINAFTCSVELTPDATDSPVAEQSVEVGRICLTKTQLGEDLEIHAQTARAAFTRETQLRAKIQAELERAALFRSPLTEFSSSDASLSDGAVASTLKL